MTKYNFTVHITFLIIIMVMYSKSKHQLIKSKISFVRFANLFNVAISYVAVKATVLIIVHF